MSTRITDAARSLQDARAAVEAALAVFHDAVRAEVADGLSAVEAGRQAGITRQRVYNIVRAGVDDKELLRREQEWLDDFDRRYDELVETMARAIASPADLADETGRRNVERKRLTNAINGDKYKPYVKRRTRERGVPLPGEAEAREFVPTVLDDLRALAESQLASLIDDDASDPVIVDLGRQLEKAETLRAKLYAAQLEAIGGRDHAGGS